MACAGTIHSRGVSFTPYREQFTKIIGGNINYLKCKYKRGFLQQDYPGEDGMLLFPNHGIFMEFMPVRNMVNQNQ
jgi:hypothetical protein